jgi:hypothetical protein
MLFDLIRERALEREALEVDEQHGRESRKRERLGRFAQRFASWAIPSVGLSTGRTMTKEKSYKPTYHASDFSMTSVLTNASRHCCMSTLLFLVDGIGKDKYMKLLYVVDVYNDERSFFSCVTDKGF